MKSIIKSYLVRKHLLFFISIVILNTVFSCEKNSSDDETLKFYGTWRQTSRTVDDIPTTLDSTRLIIQIYANNICVLYDSSFAAVSSDEVINRSGWSYNNDLLNIAVDLPASWEVYASDSELSMERLDFNQYGEIIRTAIQYEKIANIEQEQSE